MKKLSRTEAAAWLAERDRFCILTHRRPDGDTLGSAAALCAGLRAMGKTAHILQNPEMTDKYRFLHEGLTCGEAPADATLVSVDAAAETMFPKSFVHLTDRVELAIDHHGTNSGYAALTLVDPAAAACGEIICDLLSLLRVTMSKRIAEALYIAVSTDTGCFRYANTTARTLRIAAQCLEAGADAYRINMELFERRNFARMKLDAYMTQNLELLRSGKVALCFIPLEVERELGVREDDLENVSSFARNVEGVELAVTFRTESGGATKLSVRCAPGYDASAVCARLGGGGHAGAAGARLNCSQKEAAQQVREALQELGYL